MSYSAQADILGEDAEMPALEKFNEESKDESGDEGNDYGDDRYFMVGIKDPNANLTDTATAMQWLKLYNEENPHPDFVRLITQLATWLYTQAGNDPLPFVTMKFTSFMRSKYKKATIESKRNDTTFFVNFVMSYLLEDADIKFQGVLANMANNPDMHSIFKDIAVPAVLASSWQRSPEPMGDWGHIGDWNSIAIEKFKRFRLHNEFPRLPFAPEYEYCNIIVKNILQWFNMLFSPLTWQQMKIIEDTIPIVEFNTALYDMTMDRPTLIKIYALIYTKLKDKINATHSDLIYAVMQNDIWPQMSQYLKVWNIDTKYL